MKLKYNNLILLIFLFLIPNAKSAETLFLYKGNFSRSIKIEELYKFKESKTISSKLKSLMKMTNQNEENLHKILSYKIDIPFKTSSKLMNSKIGKVFLSRISKIIHPNKIFDKNIGSKAIRSGILLSSHTNNMRLLYFNFIYCFTPAATFTNLIIPFSEVFFIKPNPIL